VLGKEGYNSKIAATICRGKNPTTYVVSDAQKDKDIHKSTDPVPRQELQY
jgi:hypothetical protein